MQRQEDRISFQKTLLLSEEKLALSVQKLMSLFRLSNEPMICKVGISEELYLSEKNFVEERQDLARTGRTLFDASLPELESEKVQSLFEDMQEAEKSLKLRLDGNGLCTVSFDPLPTAQAISLNHRALEFFSTGAAKHSLLCLHHEKPFAFLNGSKKSLHWALATREGKSPFDPKNNPLLFLALLSAFLSSLHTCDELLRASACTFGTDLRDCCDLGFGWTTGVSLSGPLQEFLEKITRANRRELADLLEKKNLPDSLFEEGLDCGHGLAFCPREDGFQIFGLGHSSDCSLFLTVFQAALTDGVAYLCDEWKDQIKDRAERNRADLADDLMPLLAKRFRAAAPLFLQAKAPCGSYRCYERFRDSKTARLLQDIATERDLDLTAHNCYERYAKQIQAELETATDLFHHSILPAAQRDLQNRSAALRKVGLAEEMEWPEEKWDSAVRIGASLEALRKQVESLGWEAKAKALFDLALPQMRSLREKVGFFAPSMKRGKSEGL